MPLIALYLGDEFVGRFPAIDDAFKAGGESHTSDKPARVEFTPDGGGPVTTWVYDPLISDWVPA
jgi:hypothetical protein